MSKVPLVRVERQHTIYRVFIGHQLIYQSSKGLTIAMAKKIKKGLEDAGVGVYLLNVPKPTVTESVVVWPEEKD